MYLQRVLYQKGVQIEPVQKYPIVRILLIVQSCPPIDLYDMLLTQSASSSKGFMGYVINYTYFRINLFDILNEIIVFEN